MEPVGDQIRAELSRVGADSGAAGDADDGVARGGRRRDRTQRVAGADAARRDARRPRARRDLGLRADPARARDRGSPAGPPEAPVHAWTTAGHDARNRLRHRRVEASPEQAREAAELTAAIEDPNLRESVAKAIKAALARTPDDRPV